MMTTAKRLVDGLLPHRAWPWLPAPVGVRLPQRLARRDARIDIIWNARDLELSDEARLALWLQKRIPTTGLGEA